MEFAQSRFYKWTKVVLWVVAVIGIALSEELAHAIVWLAVALGYTIVPWLAAKQVTARPASHDEIEDCKSTSPVVTYLNTLFDDISHINAISDAYGYELDFAKITLGTFPALYLHLSINEDRIDFIQRYKDATSSWWRGEGGKRPEELQREFWGYFCYDGNGYTAKNASFRKELEEESLSEVEYDSSGWYLSLRGLLVANAGHNCADKNTISAITECAKAHGYHIGDSGDKGSDEYVLRVTFF